MPRLWAGASAWPKVDAAHPKHQDTHVLIIDLTCFHDISRYLIRSIHCPPIMLKQHCGSITTPKYVPKAMEKSHVIDQIQQLIRSSRRDDHRVENHTCSISGEQGLCDLAIGLLLAPELSQLHAIVASQLRPPRTSARVLCKRTPGTLHILTEFNLVLRHFSKLIVERVCSVDERNLARVIRSRVREGLEVGEVAGVLVAPDRLAACSTDC